jgi:iron complex outermembrane recepter protein
MKKVIQSLLTVVGLLFFTNSMFAQTTISGTISDKNGGLPGVSVVVKGTTTGAQTDGDGKFSFTAPKGATTLTISSVGYTSQDVAIPASGVLNVTLADSDNVLGEVVISTGSRNTQRTVTDSPLAIDIIGAKDLVSTGQTSFDKALQYRVPSFNTVNTPVNDATTLLDPYEIRNMGPSRTLILINGKRKNLSSLLYVQFSPGRGETGVDLSAIPTEAIKRVEILRDGASAQYGSDAIAGVMNVILKDKYDYTSVTINTGITGSKGGAVSTAIPGGGYGGSYGVTLNGGSNLGGKGFVNYTVGLTQNNSASRSTNIDVPTEIATFGNPYSSFDDLAKFKEEGGIRFDESPINPKGATATVADMNAWNALVGTNNDKYNTIISKYLTKYPTGNNINGTGEITAAKFVINGGVKLSENTELYANAAYVTKKVNSYANFRTPYWRQDRGLLHKSTDNGGVNYIESASQLAFGSDGKDLYKGYIGYVPTFEGDLIDNNMTIGAKNETNGWKSDLSFTTGSNTQLYTVDNTVNRSLGKLSPTRFKPGGFAFSHAVGNLDVSKAVNDQLSIAFGAEARSETYTIFAGDTASYYGQGSNSFPGIQAVNAGANSRFNLGGYVDLSYDINKDFMVNGTFRTEKYSDFGNANVFKVSSRYKLADDKVTIRGSYSTGFRAPTLHQIYAQSVQANFSGGTITLSGLFNNRSAQARAMGINKLGPENSTNLSLGVGLNPMKNLSITLDYYSINVKNRIVYSSSIGTKDKTTELYKILTNAGVSTIQFFINGIETTNSGLDYVASYRNIEIGGGKLSVNLAGNVAIKSEIVGKPTEPDAITKAGSSILNPQIQSLLTEGRPKYKSILGFDYAIGKTFFSLNNTLFGPTAFRDMDNGGDNMIYIKAVFKPAVVTDLSIGYEFNKKISLTLNINNLLGVLPKWDLEFNPLVPGQNPKAEADAKKLLATPAEKSLLRGFLGFSGRYDILGYNGSQFSQLGRMFNAQMNIKF